MRNRNLNQQKKAALVENEFAHKLLECSAVPTFVIDSRHRVILWNRACEELTGMKAAEVRGSDDQWKPFYPEKRPVLADIVVDGTRGDLSHLYAKYSRSPLAPDCLQAERWSESLNGRARYILFDAAPVRDNNGKIIAAIQTLRDITARKWAEEELKISHEQVQLLLESTAEAIYGVSLLGRCTFANPACARLLGYKHPDELLDKHMHKLTHHTHRDGTTFPVEECRMNSIFRGEGVGCHVDDEVLWRADGTSFDAEYWAYPQRSGNHVVGGVVTFFDITERKLAEEQLRRTESYLSDKNRQLENERTLAHKVLENILPQQFELPGFTTAVMFRPSDRIGGDFFDAWSDGDCAHFLIGDISGHSTSAALMMAVSKGIFRSLGYTMTDPVEIVGAANRMLCPMMLDSRMFLTLVYVVFDGRDNSAAIVSAGHNPVYHLDGSTIVTIDSTGPVIGWDEEDSWESVRCRFDPGMLLFLYTDGLTEAKDATGVEFGTKLPAKLADFRSPRALVDGIFEAAERFSNGTFEDDVTIFVIGREPL